MPKEPISDRSVSVAEWLRRWTANPLRSPRVGSNPTLVDLFVLTHAIFTDLVLSLRHYLVLLTFSNKFLNSIF